MRVASRNLCGKVALMSMEEEWLGPKFILSINCFIAEPSLNFTVRISVKVLCKTMLICNNSPKYHFLEHQEKGAKKCMFFIQNYATESYADNFGGRHINSNKMYANQSLVCVCSIRSFQLCSGTEELAGILTF